MCETLAAASSADNVCRRTSDNGLGPNAKDSLAAVLKLLPQLEYLDVSCGFGVCCWLLRMTVQSPMPHTESHIHTLAQATALVPRQCKRWPKARCQR